METANKDAAVKYLTEHKQSLLERREKLMKPLQELDQEIEHVNGALRSLQKVVLTSGFRLPFDTAAAPPEFPLAQIRHLTQVQALVKIAKHYGGTFKAQEAKRLLIKAGVMRQTKNSTNVIHAVIRRSEKFDRVRPGEYRLKEYRADTSYSTTSTSMVSTEGITKATTSFQKPLQ